MTRKLVRGRSKYSYLLLAWRNCYLWVWSRGLGADSYGASVRVRRGEDWDHYRLALLQRNATAGRSLQGRCQARRVNLRARPTLTVFELSQWRTSGSARGDRAGLKRYVRLKVGPGGRQP